MADDQEYGHHPPGYDPRGPDFDEPSTEHQMIDLEKPCPVCGDVHELHETERNE